MVREHLAGKDRRFLVEFDNSQDCWNAMRFAAVVAARRREPVQTIKGVRWCKTVSGLVLQQSHERKLAVRCWVRHAPTF